MARTAIAVQPVNQTGVAPTYAAADSANGMSFTNDGRTVLHVKNGGASPITVTIVSVPCSHGRTGDISVTIANGAEKIIGVFDKALFNQSGADAGKVFVNFSASASVTVAAFKF